MSAGTPPKLSSAQRIERLVVIAALLGLILTGLPQRYASQEWARVLIIVGGGIESLRILHRFFALLLLAQALYHVVAVGYRWFVMGQRPVMLPSISDLFAPIARIFANFGGRRQEEAPKNEFVLKIEYLVIVVGVIVLGISGLTLWNPIAVTNVLPGETIPIMRSVHSDHALLTVVILVLLRIGIALLWRPQRAAIFAAQAAPASPEQLNARRRVFLPAALIIALIIVVGFITFLNSEQTAITTVPRRQAVIFAPQTIPEAGDPHIGEVLWDTLRCAFCHGANAEGGINGEPSLRNPDLTFEAFYEQVRIGRGEMPTFTEEELPDGYLVHLWAWITQPTGE